MNISQRLQIAQGIISRSSTAQGSGMVLLPSRGALRTSNSSRPPASPRNLGSPKDATGSGSALDREIARVISRGGLQGGSSVVGMDQPYGHVQRRAEVDFLEVEHDDAGRGGGGGGMGHTGGRGGTAAGEGNRVQATLSRSASRSPRVHSPNYRGGAGAGAGGWMGHHQPQQDAEIQWYGEARAAVLQVLLMQVGRPKGVVSDEVTKAASILRFDAMRVLFIDPDDPTCLLHMSGAGGDEDDDKGVRGRVPASAGGLAWEAYKSRTPIHIQDAAAYPTFRPASDLGLRDSPGAKWGECQADWHAHSWPKRQQARVPVRGSMRRKSLFG